MKNHFIVFTCGMSFELLTMQSIKEAIMDNGGIRTPFENHDDESQILTDQDVTNEGDRTPWMPL